MTLEVRDVADSGLEAVWRLGQLAFGHLSDAPFDPASFSTPCTRLAAYAGGQLAGGLTVLEHAQWFGGRAVPMAGIASVAVSPEQRGVGVARTLLAEAIHRARLQGAGISMLYPTAVGLYRSMGWELAGTLSWTRVPTSLLARVRADDVGAAAVRRCTDDPGDLASIEACYGSVARTTSGLLTRTSPPFTRGAAGVLEHDVVTLAVEGNAVTGYAAYARGSGYDADSRLSVYDLIATTPAARAALLRQLGSWASVAPTVDLRLLADDAEPWLLPEALPAPTKVVPWMLRITDLPVAVAARGWPTGVDVAVDLDVVDPQVAEHSGSCRLVVRDGSGGVEPGGAGAVRVDVRGLAVLYAGTASTAALARAGLLSGPAEALAALDAAFAGPRPQCLDYF